MAQYKDTELIAIYELGRLYFEMGYFAPSERIFAGLVSVDEGRTPARLGLGLVKLENSFFQEAVAHLREVLRDGYYVLQAKMGLCSAFAGMGETERVRSMLVEIGKELEQRPEIGEEIRALWRALAVSVESA